MDQAVRLGAERHALYPVAAGGHGAGDIGKDLAANADLAFFGLHLHRTLPFFFTSQERYRSCFHLSFYCILFSPKIQARFHFLGRLKEKVNFLPFGIVIFVCFV
jgi:hypothetical protein